MVTGVELQKYGLRNSTELQKQPVILHWGKWSESQDGVSIIIVFLMAWYIVHAQFGTQCNVIIMEEGVLQLHGTTLGVLEAECQICFKKKDREIIYPHPFWGTSPCAIDVCSVWEACHWRMYTTSLSTGTHTQHGADGARRSTICSPVA